MLSMLVRGCNVVKVWEPPAVLDGMIPNTFCWTTPAGHKGTMSRESEREAKARRNRRGFGTRGRELAFG